MIKNVIFDYGNVICKTDIRALIRSFAENEENFLLMEKAVCENWGDVDAGGDYHAYKMNAASRLPERLRASCVRFFEEWYTRTPYVDGIEETVAALKERGYKLYLLSNAPDYFYENIGHYRVFDLFDGFVVSGCEKVVKPDRRIYEIVLERFGLRAEECVFFDDLEKNVEGAKAVGIEAYRFEGDVRLIKDLLLK